MGERVVIPYGSYWSTPFARWQGAFAQLHSLRFAARDGPINLIRSSPAAIRVPEDQGRASEAAGAVTARR